MDKWIIVEKIITLMEISYNNSEKKKLINFIVNFIIKFLSKNKFNK